MGGGFFLKTEILICLHLPTYSPGFSGAHVNTELGLKLHCRYNLCFVFALPCPPDNITKFVFFALSQKNKPLSWIHQVSLRDVIMPWNWIIFVRFLVPLSRSDWSGVSWVGLPISLLSQHRRWRWSNTPCHTRQQNSTGFFHHALETDIKPGKLEKPHDDSKDECLPLKYRGRYL